MLRQPKCIPLWPLPLCVALASSAAHAQPSGASTFEVVRGTLEGVAFILLFAAFAVIVLLARRSRRIDDSLAACVKGRAEVEAIDRQAVPSDGGAQAIEAELTRRGEIAKARAYAGRRAVPHAPPARPEWAEAYFIGLQLAAAGAVRPARDLMVSVAHAGILPRRVLRLVPTSVINHLWPRADRVVRGCECLEAAVVWARIARQTPPAEAKLLEEATTNAGALFSEALRWLPDEDDVRVHIRKAEFLRERGQLDAAIAELDQAEAKIRKRLPGVPPPTFGAYASQARTSAVRPDGSLHDDLADVIRSRASVRMQQLGVPELSNGPASASASAASGSDQARKIESDLLQLDALKDRVSDRILMSVRRAALVVRLERWKGDMMRARAAASEVADVRQHLGEGFAASQSTLEPLRLSLGRRAALDVEIRWDRVDQLQFAMLRSLVLEEMRDKVREGGAPSDFLGRRKLEDFAAALAFVWLHYEPERIIQMPSVRDKLAQLSNELVQVVRDAGASFAPELGRWMEYVRGRSQIRDSGVNPPPPPPLPPPPGLLVGSLLWRTSADGAGYGSLSMQIDVLADHNLASREWSQDAHGGLELVVLSSDGSRLRKIGVFGYPSAEVRFPVSVADPLEVAGTLNGKVARIAIVDLGGLSQPVPEVLRFEVRTRQDGRALAFGEFPSKQFRIAPPTARQVSIEVLRDWKFSMNELVAYLLKLSDKAYGDTSGATILRQKLHDELGDAVTNFQSRTGLGPPELLSVEQIQGLIASLEGVRRDELQSSARRDWEGFRSVPDLRIALEQVFRSMPSSVLSDLAMSTIGLSRPGTAEPPMAPSRDTPWRSAEIEVRPMTILSIVRGDLPHRYLRDVGGREDLGTPASRTRALVFARRLLSMGGLEPARRSRIEALCLEIEDLRA